MKFLALIAAALLTGCAANGSPPGDEATGGPYPPSHHAPPPDVSPVGDCPVTASSDWRAWVNAMPGPNSQPKLMISGKVTVPTGGFTFGWSNFRVAESYPVQVFVELTATPPSGAATQAVTTQEVRGEWPLAPPVGSVTIMCGHKTLGRIAPVDAAY